MGRKTKRQVSTFMITLILFSTLVMTSERVHAVETNTITKNILVNPGFDLGPGPGWVEHSDGGWEIIVNNSETPPGVPQPFPSELYIAWLGGYSYAYDYLYQDVTIPEYATSASLKGYYYFETQLTDQSDYAAIYVDGTMVWQLRCTAPPITGWQIFWLPLSPYIGGTHQLRIVARTYTNKYPTSFFFDSLELNIDYENPDVAVTNVMPSKTVVGQGYYMPINATVENQVGYPETFNVTAYANTTEIETQEITLSNKSSTTITFTWNTTGFAYGNYTIKAIADTVEGETDTADNTLTNGIIYVGIPGDINGDGTVDVFDAVLLAGAAGAKPGDGNWNPNADINNDLIVDIFDAVILAGHAGEHYP